MAIKTIFKTDAVNNNNDELELFADNEGFISILMEDPDNDYSLCKIQLNKESALLLLELLTKEIDLL
jgi:hypothetical protein